MSIANDDEPLEDIDEDLDLDVGYRGRGRPKLPPDMKRREKISTAVTAQELKDAMIAAANFHEGPLKLQDWMRRVMNDAIAASKAEAK